MLPLILLVVYAYIISFFAVLVNRTSPLVPNAEMSCCECKEPVRSIGIGHFPSILVVCDSIKQRIMLIGYCFEV